MDATHLQSRSVGVALALLLAVVAAAVAGCAGGDGSLRGYDAGTEPVHHCGSCGGG